MLTFKWSDNSEHDFDALPEQSRKGLLSRAINRIVGNECASAVLGKAKGYIAETSQPKRKTAAVNGKEASDFLKANPDMESQWENEYLAVKLSQILDGTLGVRAEGVSAFEREVARIAKAAFASVLESHGVAWPGDGETIELAGNPYDEDALIDHYLSDKGRREAVETKANESLEEKRVAREKKAAERAAIAEMAKTGNRGLIRGLGL